MNALLARPSIQKPLRYFFAYLLFCLFAILGVEVTVNLHSALVRVGIMSVSLFGFAAFVNVWGAFFLFAMYTVAMVLLESLMNKTAKNGDLLRVGLRVFAWELGLALLAFLLPVIAAWILIQ